MVTRNLNSYTLEKLDGTPISGLFSARQLREFIPREGTKLAQEQSELIQHATHPNSQGDGEQSGDDEDQCDEEDTGRTLGDEDAAAEEREHME